MAGRMHQAQLTHANAHGLIRLRRPGGQGVHACVLASSSSELDRSRHSRSLQQAQALLPTLFAAHHSQCCGSEGASACKLPRVYNPILPSPAQSIPTQASPPPAGSRLLLLLALSRALGTKAWRSVVHASVRRVVLARAQQCAHACRQCQRSACVSACTGAPNAQTAPHGTPPATTRSPCCRTRRLRCCRRAPQSCPARSSLG